MLKSQLMEYAYLMRFHRPIGSWLLLWPTLWSLWIAGEGSPDWKNVLIFTLGVFLMRSAGCVINDYADRDFDPHIQRTKDRPLAAGRVTPRETLGLFATLVVIAFTLVLLTNRLTIYLSFGAVLLAAFYPFTKRYTYLPQIFLGAAYGWASPMAFAAEQNSVPSIAWLLWLITLLWAVAYDTMYAMVDREEDLRIGVKSSAILFGRWDLMMIGAAQIIVLVLLVLVGFLTQQGWPFYLGLSGATLLGIYQQRLIHKREPQACFKAFLNNHWLGLIIFLGMLLSYSSL